MVDGVISGTTSDGEADVVDAWGFGTTGDAVTVCYGRGMVAGTGSGRGWRAMLFDAAGHRYDSGLPIHVEGWT